MSSAADFDGTLGRPVVDFDHHAPIDEVEPEQAYRELRESCPVAWTERHGGYWVVTRHGDVGRVLKDYEHFSSSLNEFVPEGVPFSIPADQMFANIKIPEGLDPPEHGKYRRLLQSVSGPKAVAALAPRIRFWCGHFIDEFIEAGECDLVGDLAGPVPAAVILEWMGLPPGEWRRIAETHQDFHALGRQLATSPDELDDPEMVADRDWLDDRITAEIAQRRVCPRDDVIGHLVRQTVDGDPISDEYLHSMILTTISGGVVTTTSLIASALMHLDRVPADRERLIADPGLWESATEEFLRRFTPVKAHARTVTKDTVVNGCPMRRGERVLASEASACHDEEEFPRADEVVLDRFPNRHYAFGLGAHRCLGMHFAKSEFKECMKQVLARLPDYHVIEERSVAYPSWPIIGGWSSMPATFTPGRRLGETGDSARSAY
jgi:cytochrome P450